MSWAQHLRAAGHQAADAARELKEQTKQRADDLSAEHQQAQAARRALESATTHTRTAVERTREAAGASLARTGRTPVGRRIGSATRRTARSMRDLPGLSAVVDTILEKNGVNELRERLAADPADPMACIHLAAALRRVERDVRTYAAARVFVSPGSLVLRQTFRAAAGLDADSDEPAPIRLLRRSFELAKRRLAADPTDAHALHSLARIYLMQDQPHHAVRFAKMAASADPEHAGLPLITLALAYLELGQVRPARRAAEMAIRADMTLGYEIIAATDRTARNRWEASTIRAEAELLSRVTSEDRRLYDGVAYRPGELGRTVLNLQRDKSRALGTSMSDGARQFQEAATTRVQRAARQQDGSATSATPAHGNPTTEQREAP